jgi:hypothetical protein
MRFDVTMLYLNIIIAIPLLALLIWLVYYLIKALKPSKSTNSKDHYISSSNDVSDEVLKSSKLFVERTKRGVFLKHIQPNSAPDANDKLVLESYKRFANSNFFHKAIECVMGHTYE